MSLLKMHFLPLVAISLLVSTAFHGVYGLNCYSCSSLEDCAKQMQRIACKESEINCATKLDKTNAIISKSCAETCDADAICCSSELCNTFVAFDVTETATASDATATQTSTKSSDETTKEGSSDTTSSSTDKGSSDTTKSDSESTPTTVPTPATTTESHSNSGTTFTKTFFGIALGIIISLLLTF